MSTSESTPTRTPPTSSRSDPRRSPGAIGLRGRCHSPPIPSQGFASDPICPNPTGDCPPCRPSPANRILRRSTESGTSNEQIQPHRQIHTGPLPQRTTPRENGRQHQRHRPTRTKNRGEKSEKENSVKGIIEPVEDGPGGLLPPPLPLAGGRARGSGKHLTSSGPGPGAPGQFWGGDFGQ